MQSLVEIRIEGRNESTRRGQKAWYAAILAIKDRDIYWTREYLDPDDARQDVERWIEKQGYSLAYTGQEPPK